MMGHAEVPVDLFNPGQVFACIGLLEAADLLVGGARGGFDWSDPGATRFHLRVPGDAHPVATVLGFLAEAEVVAQAPPGLDVDEKAWKKRGIRVVRSAEDGPFPFPVGTSHAILPAVMQAGERRMVVDYWGDATRRDNAKFWAGMGGYPGAALLRDALDLVRPLSEGAVSDPFSVAAPQTSTFRLDWRSDYVPIGIGFSLNKHKKMEPLGYPWVEILAAVGLTHARPQRVKANDKLDYRYGVLAGNELPATLHRAALGGAVLPFERRTFRMRLDWPGQENQARCITDVNEES